VKQAAVQIAGAREQALMERRARRLDSCLR